LTALPDDEDTLFKISARVSKVYDELRPKTSDQIRIFFAERRLHLVETRLAALEGQEGN